MAGNNLKMDLVLEYKSVFDDEPKAIGEYLTGISQKSVLMACSYFLSLNYANTEYSDIVKLLSKFFRHTNNDFANAIYDRCKKLKAENNNPRIIVINVETSLQLFQYAYNHLNEEQTQTEEEIEVNLFKAIIVQNQINTAKDATISQTVTGVPNEHIPAIWMMVNFFRNTEFYNYDVYETFITQLIKASIVFKFLESSDSTKALLAGFLAHFNSANWKEYLKKFIPLTTVILNPESKESYYEIVVPKDENFDQHCAFIEKLMATKIDEDDSRDFIDIRDKPFYRIEDGTYRIIFKLFVLEKIYKGLFFLLWDINKKLPNAQRVKGDFKSYWGNEVAEKQLLYETLNYIFKKRYITKTGEQISVTHEIDGGPDYYMRNGKRTFLFESKDVLIKADIKRSTDYSVLSPELNKKFYYEAKDDGSIKPKAIKQLIRGVKMALRKEFTFDTNYKENALEIYPILITHDNLFNTAGFNIFLNWQFKEELEKQAEEENIDISGVRRITVIDLDSFIFNQDLFADKKLILQDVINEYIKQTTFNHHPKKPYQGIDDAKAHLQATFIPFSMFLSNYVRAKGWRSAPKAFKEIGMEIVNGNASDAQQ